MKNQLNITSFDHEDLKQNLIDFLQSTGEFNDFNFEGSTLNTIIDLLVRNTHYDSFLANMLANESFINSAQLRQNVVSHAEKLSYTPKSSTAARLICDIEVTPSSTNNLPRSIVLEPGTPFIGSDGQNSYTFTNKSRYVLTYNSTIQKYKITDVHLYQGYLITNSFNHVQNQSITIPNSNCDTSTISVNENSSNYIKSNSISELSSDSNIFFLSENSLGLYEISFGRNILGNEPVDDSEIKVSYIATEPNHAFNVKQLICGSLIGGYANISVLTTTSSYGGSEKENIEDIRFIAPKYYQAQDRALTDSDYIPIIKERFPFVESMISWGGETNNPPRYGSVFISIISDRGSITNAVKQDIVSYLSSKNVGSVTPIIVEPINHYLNLDVQISYDNRKTSDTFATLSSKVKAVIDEYNNNSLLDFGRYYNNSEVISRIKDINGIISVDISKSVYSILDVQMFENPVYEIYFRNKIKPGSILCENFSVSIGSSNEKMYDDSNGNIILFYVDSNGKNTTRTVGNVNYELGEIEFIINIIDSSKELKVSMVPDLNNFFVEQNTVVSIDEMNISLNNNQEKYL